MAMRDLNDCPIDLDRAIRPVDGFQNTVPVIRECEFTAEDHRNSIEYHIRAALPTLSIIGLTDALLEIEKVLAWNETEKHPNAKWKTKTIGYHDDKAVKHLNCSKFGITDDHETGLPHRAHAACRLLMALALELNLDK